MKKPAWTGFSPERLRFSVRVDRHDYWVRDRRSGEPKLFYSVPHAYASGTGSAGAVPQQEPQCVSHGDPLVCLACEVEEDKQPVWNKEQTVNVPFSRELTVVVQRDTGAQQADACLEHFKDPQHGQQLIVTASEMFFHRLRLRAEEDASLHDRVVVFYQDGERLIGPIGLRKDDELSWPAGFLHEQWENEVAIDKLRQQKARPAVPSLPAPDDKEASKA